MIAKIYTLAGRKFAGDCIGPCSKQGIQAITCIGAALFPGRFGDPDGDHHGRNILSRWVYHGRQ